MKRILTAVIVLPFLIASILISSLWWVFVSLAVAAMVLGLWEFYLLAKKLQLKPDPAAGYVAGAALVTIAVFNDPAAVLLVQFVIIVLTYLGTILGGGVLFLVIIFCILVLGADNTARLTYPSYKLGMRISIGDFFERVEVIVAFIWVFTEYFKLTICFYGLALGLAQLMGLQNYKILLFPLAFLILTFTIFSHPDLVHYQHFMATAWTPLSLTICFIMPLLLLTVGKIRGR